MHKSEVNGNVIRDQEVKIVLINGILMEQERMGASMVCLFLEMKVRQIIMLIDLCLLLLIVLLL